MELLTTFVRLNTSAALIPAGAVAPMAVCEWTASLVETVSGQPCRSIVAR